MHTEASAKLITSLLHCKGFLLRDINCIVDRQCINLTCYQFNDLRCLSDLERNPENLPRSMKRVYISSGCLVKMLNRWALVECDSHSVRYLSIEKQERFMGQLKFGTVIRLTKVFFHWHGESGTCM